MKKPLIGITLDNEDPGNYSKFPWYAIRRNYLHSVEYFGGIPIPLLHAKKNVDDIFNLLDGLIITGGNFDISPEKYGKYNKESRIIKNDRTNFEILLCKKFLNSNKPLLGICGGHQLINVACGGNLIQDLKTYNKNALNHEQPNPRNETSHAVNIINDTLLYKILKNKVIQVNSAHHQAIDQLGKNLRISGCSSDDTIESIESINHKWCIGVQWHPEFLITKEDKYLIKHMIETSFNK